MNEAIIAGGSLATMFLILGIIITITEGIKEALAIITLCISVIAGAALIVLFWTWLAGAFF